MFVKITRYLSISALAISITLGCFALMQHLLHQADSQVPTGPEYNPITFVDIKVPENQPPPPRPVKPEHKPPPELIKPETSIPVVQSEPVVTIEGLDITGFPDNGVPVYIAGPRPALDSAADNQLIQLVTISPPYPIAAARAGIEGWVKIQFNVNAAGLVSDPVVIDSQPKRVFDQAAIAAILKSRFQPRSFNAQSLSAIQVIDFTLKSD